MGRSAGKTHTLYPVAGLHKGAVVDCYRCGTKDKAYRMQWLKNRHKNACAALCPSCQATHRHEYGEQDWEAVAFQAA